MKRLSLIAFLILTVNCTNDNSIRTITSDEERRLSHFENLNPLHQLQIADHSEPGERLQLCMTFLNEATNDPVMHRDVAFYHTNINGLYEPTETDDETTARLSGKSQTDDQGRIFVTTILPGNYGSSSDNRHIHTTVFDAKPEAYDIHFKQYIGRMGKNFVEGSDQHFLADLIYSKDSILTTFITIKVKNP